MDRWCAERQVTRGAVAPIQQVWHLAVAWYADRLDDDWTPRAPAAMERLFADAGLTGDFWRVR